MARKPMSAAEAVVVDLNHEAIAADTQAATMLVQREAQIDASYGDGLPYDKARVVGEARWYMGQSAQAMLEAGRRLILLKEHEPHGDFMVIVEQQLQLNPRTAQRMMAAAAKYLAPAIASKSQAPALLALGTTKLFELMVEDDEAIEALADGGTLAGLKLDDIEAMTARELRAAVRKERDARKKDGDAKDKVLAKKEAKITELETQLALRHTSSTAEAEQAALEELRNAALACEDALRLVVQVVNTVTQAPATDAADLAARQTLDYLLQRLVDDATAHGMAVDVLGERVEPGWIRPIKDAVSEYQAAKTRG